MKKILLGFCASLLVISLSAQVNMLKNSNMEAEGEWLVSYGIVTELIPYTFGSTENTVNGGEGGNLAIKYMPNVTEANNIIFYQALDLVGGQEYLWSCAMRDLSPNLNGCWWTSYCWVPLEPVDGTDPAEVAIVRMNEWQNKTAGFDGLWDTATAMITAESKENIFIPEADGQYFVGINLGTCIDGANIADLHFIFDEVTMIDQDAEPVAVEPQYDNNGNSLSVYPNPARSSINLTYRIRENSDVTLSVVNILGQEVATVFKESRTKGTYTERFDCSNLNNGIYFGLLKVDNTLVKKKIMVLK